MAVAIKLYKIGKKGRPAYRIVVSNKRYKANGKYIEEIGFYDPIKEPFVFELKKDRYQYWLSKGAVISEGVAKLLKNKNL